MWSASSARWINSYPTTSTTINHLYCCICLETRNVSNNLGSQLRRVCWFGNVAARCRTAWCWRAATWCATCRAKSATSSSAGSTSLPPRRTSATKRAASSSNAPSSPKPTASKSTWATTEPPNAFDIDSFIHPARSVWAPFDWPAIRVARLAMAQYGSWLVTTGFSLTQNQSALVSGRPSYLALQILPDFWLFIFASSMISHSKLMVADCWWRIGFVCLWFRVVSFLLFSSSPHRIIHLRWSHSIDALHLSLFPTQLIVYRRSECIIRPCADHVYHSALHLFVSLVFLFFWVAFVAVVCTVAVHWRRRRRLVRVQVVAPGALVVDQLLPFGHLLHVCWLKRNEQQIDGRWAWETRYN